jgi:hypothetical protein
VGYTAGSPIGTVYEEVSRYQSYLLAFLGVLVAALVVRHLLRRRRGRHGSEGPR